LDRNIYTKDLPSKDHPDRLYRRNRIHDTHSVRRFFKDLWKLIPFAALIILIIGFVQLQRVPNYLILYENKGDVQALYNTNLVQLKQIYVDEERYSVYLFDVVKIKELQVDRIKECSVVPSGKVVFVYSDYIENGEIQTGWGTGTLSFVTDDGDFAAIGHNMSMKIGKEYHTSLLDAKVTDIVSNSDSGYKSLHADIVNYDTRSYAYKQSYSGIYGKYGFEVTGQRIPIALRGEIQDGKASIITTIEGAEPVIYDVNVDIEKISSDSYGSKFLITIVDEDYFKISSCILKGMSGSPVIQNGKVIGVVAQIYNEKTAFCTFADEMLRDLQKMDEE
jgi:hypothetical protein